MDTGAKAVLQILIAARELVSEPSRWTQRAFARDKDGTDVASTAEAACCWCLGGAVTKVAGRGRGDGAGRRASMLLHEASLNQFGRDYVVVNDGPGATLAECHANVLSLLDEAIAAARASEPSHADS